MSELTVKDLEALRPKDANRLLNDGGGLRGRVRLSQKADNGVSVTFTYRYRWESKTHDEPCGTWPNVNLRDIRRKRDAIREQVRNRINPAEHRKVEMLRLAAEKLTAERRIAEETAAAEILRHQQEQLASRATVRQLFETWGSIDLKARKDSGAETKRGFEKDVLPTLGDRFVESIKRSDIMAVLDNVKQRGANRLANRLLSEIRQMFGFALLREIVASDPTHGIAKRDVGGKETERDRTLSEKELRALPGALASSNLLESTVHAIWLMVATGARVGEVTRSRRQDFDFQNNTWTIPKEHAKNKKEHVIFLSDFAKRHAKELVCLSTDDFWVMPARKHNEPDVSRKSVCPKSITKQIEDRQLSHYQRAAHSNRTAHAHTLELAGGKWTPHDLRRTAATLMGELRVDGDVITKCLNQIEEHKVKRIYQRHIRREDQIDAWKRLGDQLARLTRPH